MSIFKASKNILNTEMLEAARLGDGRVVETKLKAGADPNAMRTDGYNALMLAVGNKTLQDAKVHYYLSSSQAWSQS